MERGAERVYSSSCLTNTTRHPSRTTAAVAVAFHPCSKPSVHTHTHAHTVSYPLAALVDGGTMINSLQDECCCCCSGIGSPPACHHRFWRTPRGPLGGFTPFDRIELDIFALIIRRRRRSFRARIYK